MEGMTDDGSITRTPGTDTAVLAGGCFWGMEDLIRRQPGVLDTRVGYTGGQNDHATYRNHPGHAEAVEIVYDPTKTTYRDILAFFFQIHDPSTLNRQGNDIGTSYRSAIFPLDAEQERVARDRLRRTRGRRLSTAALTNGPLVIDQARRTAHLDGVLLALSDVEFRLLTVLARHTGEVVGWRTILNEVWSTAETMGGRDMIKTTVYRLRQQLGPAAERLIVTVRGSGYLMPRQEDDGSPTP